MSSYFAIESWDGKFYQQIGAGDIQEVFGAFESELKSGEFKTYEIGATNDHELNGKLPEDKSIIGNCLLAFIKENNDQAESGGEIRFTLQDDTTGPEGDVVGTASNKGGLGLSIAVDGFTNCNSNDNKGCIAFFEKYEDKVKLLVYADVNEELPTHTICLEGARNSARIEDYFDGLPDGHGLLWWTAETMDEAKEWKSNLESKARQ